MNEKTNQHIIEGIEPKYFARIPNMAVDDLNYAELALYVHYKRIASDRGKCWQSTKQVSKQLGMSQPKVRKTRDALVEKGLIVVTMRMNEDAIECNSRLITIINVWEQNVNRYAPPIETDIPPSRKRHTPMAKTSYKEELKKEEPKKKDSQPKVGGVQPVTEMGQGDTQCAHVFSDGVCIDCGQVEPPRVIQDDEGHFVAGPVKIYTPTPRQPVKQTNILASSAYPGAEDNEPFADKNLPCARCGGQSGEPAFYRGQNEGELYYLCGCYLHGLRSSTMAECKYCGTTKIVFDDFGKAYHLCATVAPLIPDESAGQGETCDGCRRLSANGICSFSSSLNPEYPINKNRTRCEMYNTDPFELPPNDGRKVGRKPPSVDPAIKAATPINVIPRKERLVLPEEPEPEAKPKTKKDIRDEMKTAVLDAVGWQPSDVNHWGRIQKVVTTLLKKGATVELLAEWRDWNAALECGKVQNPEGITGNGWPKFMKHKRDQATPTHKPTPELDIQVDEEYQ